MEKLAILIVQDKADKELWEKTLGEEINALVSQNGLYFYKIIHNRAESARVLEGLPVTEVHYTPEVLIKGLHQYVYDVLVNNFVRSSINPGDVFHVFNPKRPA